MPNIPVITTPDSANPFGPNPSVPVAPTVQSPVGVGQLQPAAPVAQLLQPAAPTAAAPSTPSPATPQPTPTPAIPTPSTSTVAAATVNAQPANSQTFSLGNGKTYDNNGNEIDQNGNTIGSSAGLAGLSAADFLSLLGSAAATNSNTNQQIQQSLGIPQTAGPAFAPPAQTTVDFYNQAYQTAGLGQLKQQIADLNDEIAQANQDYINAAGKENENPFLSEAARVGRVQNLYNTAQSTIGNLLNKQTNIQNLYAQGVNEVNNAVTRYTNDFTENQTINQQKLSYLLSQAETYKTAAQNTQIQQLIERYFPQYASTYAQTQAAEKPFGTPQTGLYTYNPQTKTYTQVSPPVGQFSPITTPLGQVYGFNANTGQVNQTGTNTYTGQSGSVGGMQLPTGGNFPAGSQTPGSAAAVNNPGGLKDPTTGQFMQFATPDQGFAALVQDVQGKMTGNTRTGTNGASTLLQLSQAWKGTGNNDVQSWAQSVAQNYGQGATVNTAIGQLDPVQLAAAIAKHETGYLPGTMPANNNVGALAVQSSPSSQPDMSGVNDLMQAFQNLSPSFSNPQQLALSTATFQKYLASGNVDAATQFLNTLAYKNMQPATQSKVDNISQAIDAYQQALSIISKHPELSTGRYQDIVQSAKPWAGANPTKDYQQFQQMMNIGNSLLQNGLYGIRLNPTDISRAQSFEPGNDDPTATVATKLKGAIAFFQYANASLYGQQTGIQPPALATFLQSYGAE